MRIAHVTATFPPHYTGTGMVCYHNALGLARLGHEVTVFTADDAPADHVDPQEITVRRLPILFRFGNAPFLPQLVRLEGFDVVHLHYPFYFGSEMIFYRSLAGGPPYVVTYHQDVLFQGALRYPERVHHRLLGRRILARAAKVLATSLDYARSSRLADLLRARPEALGEMPNGVDVGRFQAATDGSSVRDRYSLAQDRVILFVGALDRAHYFKGVHVLLQALARMAGNHTRLVVVGEGDLRKEYQRQAVELGLGERVVFCGRVPDEDLPAHYAAADVVVLPSTTMGEAFGVVLLEAMASGKPVVASNLPGVRSVVQDGQDGFLAEAGNADDLAAKIDWLLTDAECRQEMGRKGRSKVAEHYDWPRLIPQLVGVYKEVLEVES